MILKCVECNKEIGESRPGGGRQTELCKECFRENRLKNNRLQDQRRKAGRQSMKRGVRNSDQS